MKLDMKAYSGRDQSSQLPLKQEEESSIVLVQGNAMSIATGT
jgi:hypothetical protein